jgi:RTX calcium-binding nonapeptide repeat (4 copies)
MHTKAKVGLVVGACTQVLAPAAMALTIIGTEGDDKIFGSRQDDRIKALAGNDTVHAFGGDDQVHAGQGDDRVGGYDGADDLRGKAGNDRVRAGDGRDRVAAGPGADAISGGDGHDLLTAAATEDVPVEGVDTIAAGGDNDKVRARDGEPDEIDCGRGNRDIAVLDLVDVIVDAKPKNPNGSCEAVLRADVPPEEPAPE